MFQFLRSTEQGRRLHIQPTPTPISPWGPISAIRLWPRKLGSTLFNLPSPPEVNRPGTTPTDLDANRIKSPRSAQVNDPTWCPVIQTHAPRVNWVADAIRGTFGSGSVRVVCILFSSVYACKETVEHVPLSTGGKDHHHPHGDEEELVIDFPVFMTFISLFGTTLIFENTKIMHRSYHSPLSFAHLVSFKISSPARRASDHGVRAFDLDPFIAGPLFFCEEIVFIGLVLPTGQYGSVDLILAFIIALQVTYQACVMLSVVLLQTSPPSGLTNGKMEAFLSAMRELEDTPAPHIW